MRRATRITTAILGSYAGLVGIEHGYSELAQGAVPPGGTVFNAIGPPCQPDAVWHACLPATTVLPTLRWAGISTLVIAAALVIWSIAWNHRRFGGWVQVLLSAMLLAVGGGFVAPFVGIVAGLTATRLNTPLPDRQPGPASKAMAKIWPWPVALMIIWLPLAWILGQVAGAMMLRLGTVTFLLFDIGLPIASALSAVAHNHAHTIPNHLSVP